jgi:hypothetical protein
MSSITSNNPSCDRRTFLSPYMLSVYLIKEWNAICRSTGTAVFVLLTGTKTYVIKSILPFIFFKSNQKRSTLV